MISFPTWPNDTDALVFKAMTVWGAADNEESRQEALTNLYRIVHKAGYGEPPTKGPSWEPVSLDVSIQFAPESLATMACFTFTFPTTNRSVITMPFTALFSDDPCRSIMLHEQQIEIHTTEEVVSILRAKLNYQESHLAHLRQITSPQEKINVPT